MAVRYDDDTLWSQVTIGSALAPHESFDVFSGTRNEDNEAVEIWLLRPAALGSLTPDAVLGFLEAVEGEAAPDSMDDGPHEHALLPIAYGIQSGRVFAAYPAGPPPLNTLLAGSTSLNPAQAVTIVSSALETVGESPHPGITGRNVLLAEDGSVRVTEYGFPVLLPTPAIPFRQDIPDSAYTAAPERSLGTAVNDATQIYAGGSLLFWLLTGRPPFRADTAGELYTLHRESIPPLLVASHPELSPELGLAIDRALSKSPEDRFDSIEEFLGAIQFGKYPGMASPDLTQQVPALAAAGALETSALPAVVPSEPQTPAEPVTAIAGQEKSRSFVWLFLLALFFLPFGAFLVGGALVTGNVLPNVFGPGLDPPTIAIITATPTTVRSTPETNPDASATPIASPSPVATPTSGPAAPTVTPVPPTPVPPAQPTPPTSGGSGGGSGGSGGPTVASHVSQASACWDKDWPCVIRNLEAAQSMEPGNAQVSDWLVQSYVNYGVMLMRNQRPFEGLPWLEKAVKRDPSQQSVIFAALLESPRIPSLMSPPRQSMLIGSPVRPGSRQ